MRGLRPTQEEECKCESHADCLSKTVADMAPKSASILSRRCMLLRIFQHVSSGMLESQLDQVQGPCTWVLHLSDDQAKCIAVHLKSCHDSTMPSTAYTAYTLKAPWICLTTELTCRQAPQVCRAYL